MILVITVLLTALYLEYNGKDGHPMMNQNVVSMISHNYLLVGWKRALITAIYIFVTLNMFYPAMSTLNVLVPMLLVYTSTQWIQHHYIKPICWALEDLLLHI